MPLTEIPGRMNSEAISLQKEKIFNVTKRMPIKANICVVGDAHLSITGMASIVSVVCADTERWC